MMTTRGVLGRGSVWIGVGAVVLLAACSMAPHPSKTVLTGEKEVPPVQTSGSGLSDISVRNGVCPGGSSSNACNMLVGTVQTTGVNGTAAHVHQGAPGENGPVIVTLIKSTSDVWLVPSGTALSETQYQAYLAGNLYVNVHTEANKGGEVRAQLRPVTPKF